jgi:ABC-type Fe3+-hydroxamate transport system substrate-binding protein
MHKFLTDQMGRQIQALSPPARIISLVPSQTELLFDLGLDEEIIGVTRFCIHPHEKTAHKTRIGGTKDFDIEKIKALKPDLIIGNKEENYEEGIYELQKHFPVWMSDIYCLDDAYQMMEAVGEITNKPEEAKAIISEIKSNFQSLRPALRPPPLSCAYFIWRKPYMVAAPGTFIDHMLGVLGVKNAFNDMARYPAVTMEQIEQHQPNFIFLSSEPYSFSERHISEFQNISPLSKIMIVDGELFSWYGSRLRYTAKYFGELRKVKGLDNPGRF